MTQTTFLLQLSLGPVQGFIATARRSRDLWFGSYVLSEVSKAAAASLHASHAALIFPSPADAKKDLEPWSDFLVANIVTAELVVADLQAAADVLSAADRAAQVRWEQLCDEARDEIGDAHPATAQSRIAAAAVFLRTDVWKAQLSDVVEVFHAIVPLAGSYPQANQALRTLMANRKNTRDFAPYADRFNWPKSSLDGAQSSVIPDEADPAARQRLGIEPAEQLDTAGVVKRVVGRRRGFVPAARVAAAPWIERAAKQGEDFEKLKAACKALPEDLATELRGRYREYEWVSPFPFDAQSLYAERIDAELARREWAASNSGQRTRVDENGTAAVKSFQSILARLKKELGEPPAYYGLLLADGDRMGGLINKAAQRGADAHREVSRALSGFAQKVPALMSRLGGACIYSGGDDVLGLVSLPQAVACAQALEQAFRQALREVARTNSLAEHDWPTLSVGIAVAHFLEPLGDVRALAVQAERLAKGSSLALPLQRNALAMLMKPRAGNAISFRIRWGETDRLDRLQSWMTRFVNGELPRGLPHELRSQWDLCESVHAHGGAKAGDFSSLWRSLMTTLLSRKREGGGGELLSATTTQALVKELCEPPTAAAQGTAAGNAVLRDQLDLMLAAQWLSGQAETVRS